jgi:hypothetical protein
VLLLSFKKIACELLTLKTKQRVKRKGVFMDVAYGAYFPRHKFVV